MGYSPCGRRESDTPERLTAALFSICKVRVVLEPLPGLL